MSYLCIAKSKFPSRIKESFIQKSSVNWFLSQKCVQWIVFAVLFIAHIDNNCLKRIGIRNIYMKHIFLADINSQTRWEKWKSQNVTLETAFTWELSKTERTFYFRCENRTNHPISSNSHPTTIHCLDEGVTQPTGASYNFDNVCSCVPYDRFGKLFIRNANNFDKNANSIYFKQHFDGTLTHIF